ncbi:MAG: phosphoribosyl-AMP cyclohydrolase [Actinomycetota bacterium]
MKIPAEVAAHFAEGTLVTAIAQDVVNGQVLMVAWMNEEALSKTLETGYVTYWSRSRKQLWTKGETSGNTQKLITISYDCDGDALLLQVEQIGAACHTGERSCFFREIGAEQ